MNPNISWAEHLAKLHLKAQSIPPKVVLNNVVLNKVVLNPVAITGTSPVISQINTKIRTCLPEENDSNSGSHFSDTFIEDDKYHGKDEDNVVKNNIAKNDVAKSDVDVVRKDPIIGREEERDIGNFSMECPESISRIGGMGSSNGRNGEKLFLLDGEINKIKSLNIFKRRLIHNILKYLRFHKLFDRKRFIERQLYNHFPNWFFQLNMDGYIVDFIPRKPFFVQDNLDYIFHEKKIVKKVDFDLRLLSFDPRYIKQITVVEEIMKKETDDHIYYALKTNVGFYRLLPISRHQYRHLHNSYNGPTEKFDELLSIILARYKFLGGMNNHLSIPPEVYRFLGVSVELFGTPLNTHSNIFCSPFYDMERFFGSCGSFFTYKLHSGITYAANPPFSATIIEKLANKINSDMEYLTGAVVYIVIPNWEDDFKALDILKNSKYLREVCGGFNKFNYPYYHYYKMKYVPAVNSLILVYASPDVKFSEPKTMAIKGAWPNDPSQMIRPRGASGNGGGNRYSNYLSYNDDSNFTDDSSLDPFDDDSL